MSLPIKLLSLFFCFLSTGVVLGEGSNDAAKNYLNYYRSVAIAEEAVVNGNYRDAIRQYQLAFEEYPYNNPIDCYIAAQVSSYSGDTASCLRFICKGLCFGLPVQTIISNPHLTGLIKRIDDTAIDSCLRIYRERIDTKARATMLSLIKRDQEVVHNLPSGERLYEADEVTLKDLYRPIWDSLLREVLVLTRKSGFPAQKIIGTQNGEDSLFKVGPNSVFALYIFIHHGNAWKQASDLLWAELLKGNITPQMYGVIYESSHKELSYDNPVYYFASRPCQEKRCKTLVEKNLKEINSARWEIGLGSYEVMEKKFESRYSYYKWSKKGTGKKEPFFDFQCDLGFQGK